MRHLILTLIFGLLPILVSAQTDAEKGQFGFALNSSMNGEIYPIRLVPSVTYFNKNSQFELGFGIHPFIRKDQNIYSGEFNYKFFPNGTGNKFNMYVIGRFSYIHNPRDTYYPTTYNYLFLNGGYGFQLVPFKNAYMGTNISIGTFTYNKRSEIPYDGFTEKNLFDSFGFNLAFQFNFGYRF
ncbi:MAG: hypothetical protein MK078_03755 [Crocinitomicaceae bacterium]|nr:hypothetical protein [Crocinitomicaceae bacterium]